MKTFKSQYTCPDGHVTVERQTIHEDTIICTHPRLGDDTDPLIDNADICGKKATRSDNRPSNDPSILLLRKQMV